MQNSLKKKYVLSNLAGISEVALTVCIVNHFVLYALRYYKIAMIPLKVSTILIIISASMCLLSQILLHVSGIGKDWDKSHKFLGQLKSQVDPYETYAHSLKVHMSYLWRRWVLPLSFRVLFSISLLLSVFTIITNLIVFAIRDSWQYVAVIIPLFCQVDILILFAIYLRVKTIPRVGTGLLKYLIHNNESLYTVSDDFKSAQKISKNIRISDDRIYYRNKTNIIIVNRDKIECHKNKVDTILIKQVNECKYDYIVCKSSHEFNAVLSAVIRSEW